MKCRSMFNLQPVWQQLVTVIIFNSLIALLIRSLLPNSDLGHQFFLSQSIGLSIFANYLIFASFVRLRSWAMLIPIVTGSVMGIAIVVLINAALHRASADTVIAALNENINSILSILFSALFFGVIIVFFFSSREAMLRTKAKLQEQQMRELKNNKKLAETNLRLLQAQIEPHFLFNTLSNVISLIQTDPEKSKTLLESLATFLRATLHHSKATNLHLRDEIELVSNYLRIFKLRMGKRLTYAISCNEDVKACPFPPLLIQPLVENAIIHGIEPQAEGGTIEINIGKNDGYLVIQVADTGKGLRTDFISGFGLSNIRERIKSMYDERARLSIEENQPHGVIATIHVPYENL